MARLRSRGVLVQPADNSPSSSPGNYLAKSIAKAQQNSRRSSRLSADQDSDLQATTIPALSVKRKSSSASVTTQASKRRRKTKPTSTTNQPEEHELSENEAEDAPMNLDLVKALNSSAPQASTAWGTAKSSSVYNLAVQKGSGRKRSARRGTLPQEAVVPSPIQEEEEEDIDDQDYQRRGQEPEHEHEGEDQEGDAYDEDEEGQSQHGERYQTDRSDSLFVTQRRTISPELGAGVVGSVSRPSIYDVPETEDRPRYLPSSGQPQFRRTINGLSANNPKPSSSRPGRSLMPKRGLDMDNPDFGYADSQTQRPAKDKQPLRPGMMRQREGEPSGTMQSLRGELAQLRQEIIPDEAESEDDSAENEENSEDEKALSDQGAEEGVDGYEVPSAGEQQFTVDASTTAIRALQNIMARPAFVGKRHWYKHLGSDSEHDHPPGTHTLGRTCIQLLDKCIRMLGRAPKSPDLGAQRDWFQERQENLSKGLADIGKLIKHICKKLTSGADDHRRNLMADVLQHVIPRMVRLLWTIGCLGGVERKAEGTVEISRTGVYNTFTLSYLRSVTSWLRYLNEIVQAGRNIARVRNVEEEMKRKKNRDDFGIAIDNWHEELVDVEKELESKIQHEDHILQSTQRDEVVRRQREEEAEKEIEVSQRKYDLFCRSVQQIIERPGPMEEKRRRMREALLPQPLAQVPPPAIVRGPRPRTPQPPEVSLPQEDRAWLLRQLRGTAEYPRHDPPTDADLERWTSILGASEEIVFDEVVYLIDRTNYLSWERGTEPEPWAQIAEPDGEDFSGDE